MKTDRTQALRKYLSAGKTVRDAAACAGITAEELPEALAALQEDRKTDTLPIAQVGFSRLMLAVDVLEELALNAEDERTRQSAAKALVDFALQSQKLRTAVEGVGTAREEGKTHNVVLWDFT